MVTIYLVRHGKTMFNTIGRAQGWSDSPLTAVGEAGVSALGAGFKQLGIRFDRAYSSDSGRTIQTIGLILANADNQGIPYHMDKRIREWSFGSLDGGYDGELFDGVLPLTDAIKGRHLQEVDYETIANGILEVDTAGWAEPWSVIKERIWSGFNDMAKVSEVAQDQNLLIVSHGMTIGTFIKLIDPSQANFQELENASVTKLHYEQGAWQIQSIGDTTYRETGRQAIG